MKKSIYLDEHELAAAIGSGLCSEGHIACEEGKNRDVHIMYHMNEDRSHMIGATITLEPKELETEVKTSWWRF